VGQPRELDEPTDDGGGVGWEWEGAEDVDESSGAGSGLDLTRSSLGVAHQAGVGGSEWPRRH
jgi:hypothetical protein